MALRRLSLPIIFAVLLLCSLVLARELEEKPAADKKDADLNVDRGSPYYRHGGPGYGHGGGGYGHGGGGYGRGCRYRCRFGRCCSAEEYAEFVQAGN